MMSTKAALRTTHKEMEWVPGLAFCHESASLLRDPKENNKAQQNTLSYLNFVRGWLAVAGMPFGRYSPNRSSTFIPCVLLTEFPNLQIPLLSRHCAGLACNCNVAILFSPRVPRLQQNNDQKSWGQTGIITRAGLMQVQQCNLG
eukprot:225895-Pelagomonas_calceolata.AAC.2